MRFLHLHRGGMVDAKNCNVVAEPHIKYKRFQRRSAEAIAGIESCRCKNIPNSVAVTHNPLEIVSLVQIQLRKLLQTSKFVLKMKSVLNFIKKVAKWYAEKSYKSNAWLSAGMIPNR